jgi:hypothetical protein
MMEIAFYLDLLETYDGSAPARLWAEAFQRVKDYAGWDEATALLMARCKLQGKAKQWDTLRWPFPSVAVFLQRLQEQYPALPVGDAVAALQCCKVEPGELVRDYAVRFQALAQVAELPEPLKLKLFCNGGLPAHIGVHLLHLQPATVAEAIGEAITVERYGRSMAGPGAAMQHMLHYGNPYYSDPYTQEPSPYSPAPSRPGKDLGRERKQRLSGGVDGKRARQERRRLRQAFPAGYVAQGKTVDVEELEEQLTELEAEVAQLMQQQQRAYSSYEQHDDNQEAQTPTALQERVYQACMGAQRPSAPGRAPVEVKVKPLARRKAPRPRVVYLLDGGEELSPAAAAQEEQTSASGGASGPWPTATMAACTELEYQVAFGLVQELQQQELPTEAAVQAHSDRDQELASELLDCDSDLEGAEAEEGFVAASQEVPHMDTETGGAPELLSDSESSDCYEEGFNFCCNGSVASDDYAGEAHERYADGGKGAGNQEGGYGYYPGSYRCFNYLAARSPQEWDMFPGLLELKPKEPWLVAGLPVTAAVDFEPGKAVFETEFEAEPREASSVDKSSQLEQAVDYYLPKPFDPGGHDPSGMAAASEAKACGYLHEPAGLMESAFGVVDQSETRRVEQPGAGHLVFGPVTPHWIDPG